MNLAKLAIIFGAFWAFVAVTILGIAFGLRFDQQKLHHATAEGATLPFTYHSTAAIMAFSAFLSLAYGLILLIIIIGVILAWEEA